jgi:heme/copper-type cytochrome/quinol oxidase subunit 1
MTTIDTRPDALSLSGTQSGAGRLLSGVASWVTTADHKRIGRLFMVFALAEMLVTAAVGALLGFERISTSSTALDGDAIGQMFTYQRIGLSFFVVAPLLIGLAIAVVPLQLGARSLALPRLGALGFWLWGGGGVLVDIAYLSNGGPGGGNEKMVDLFLVGFGLALVGLIAAAATVVVSVLTTRAPGMTLARAPMFAWASLAGCTAMVLALPVLVGDLILLAVDHRYSRAGFGGNTGIADWMGWSITQPTTYIYAIGALGITAEVVATASRRRLPLRGGFLIGIGIFSTAVLAAVTQRAHLLPWDGSNFTDMAGDKIKDLLPYVMFNVLPILGLVIVLGLSSLALKSGKPKISAPFVFAFLGTGMLITGAAAHILTGVVDLQLVGSVYEEGVFIYMMYGAVLVGLGGVAYWGPKLWGRTMPDKQVIPLALLGFLGTVAASLPLIVAGFQGQPAGAISGYDYKISPELLNTVVLAGHALMLLTVLGFAALALKSFTTGAAAGDDPWDAHTLEWATSSPPPANNFSDLHTVSSAEPLFDLKPSRSDA